jgi:hypothetical protein
MMAVFADTFYWVALTAFFPYESQCEHKHWESLQRVAPLDDDQS